MKAAAAGIGRFFGQKAKTFLIFLGAQGFDMGLNSENGKAALLMLLKWLSQKSSAGFGRKCHYQTAAGTSIGIPLKKAVPACRILHAEFPRLRHSADGKEYDYAYKKQSWTVSGGYIFGHPVFAKCFG